MRLLPKAVIGMLQNLGDEKVSYELWLFISCELAYARPWEHPDEDLYWSLAEQGLKGRKSRRYEQLKAAQSLALVGFLKVIEPYGLDNPDYAYALAFWAERAASETVGGEAHR